MGLWAQKWEPVWGPKAEASLAVCAGRGEGIGGCGGKQRVGRVHGPSLEGGGLVASEPRVREAGVPRASLTV